MPVIVATFGPWKDIKDIDITNIGSFEGRRFRFPITLINSNDIGTPHQPSLAKLIRITTLVVAQVNGWGLPDSDLIKVLFQITKDHLTSRLNTLSLSDITDFEIPINTYTYKVCPYDPQLIPEPNGAEVEFEIHRRIGF